MRALHSPDGRHWASTIDHPGFAEGYPGPMATDGRRLVAVSSFAGGGIPQPAWISDDGRSWQMMPAPFPTGFSARGILHASGRFVVPGSVYVPGAGDPRHVFCTSAGGESWDCAAPTGIDDVGNVTISTSSGFLSFIEEWTEEVTRTSTFSHNTTSIATSADGLVWQLRAEDELDELIIHGATSTSHGLFVWGGTNPNLGLNVISQPFALVHRAPLD